MKDIVIVSFPDEKLNEYFEKCRGHIENYILSNNINITIHGEHGKFTQESLKNKVKEFENNYVVIIYSHGSETQIMDEHHNTILHEDDVGEFHNSIVYSTACFTANSMGFKMSNYGCKLFFGYVGKAYIPLNKTLEIDFIETDNFALMQLLSGENNCIILANKTDGFFKLKYDKIKVSDPEDAALMLHNREAVRFYNNNAEC